METSLEEEKKINSLKESHHEWDDHHQGKDHLSLSSTSLPDVGIHDPEFHGNGASLKKIRFSMSHSNLFSNSLFTHS